MNKKVLSFGATYLQFDKTGFPPLTQIKDEAEVVGKDYEIVAAGSAVTFARVCSSLGLESVYIGKVGADYLGDLVEKMLRRDGVETFLLKDKRRKTNIVDINLSENGAVYSASVGNANQGLVPEDVEKIFNQNLSSISYLYLGGCFKMKAFLLSYQTYIQKAQQEGVKVLLNHGRVTNAVADKDIDEMRQLVGHVDFYTASKDEFLAMMGTKSIEEAFAKIKDSRGITVITDGENGAFYFKNGRLVNVPAFKIKVLNPITAGDSFNAGFIKAQSEAKNLEESIHYANAVAAVKISEKGLPTEKTVSKLLS